MDSIKISPAALQSILNAALFEIARHPESYKIARNKTRELFRWITRTDWDTPDEEIIIIDEMPF